MYRISGCLWQFSLHRVDLIRLRVAKCSIVDLVINSLRAGNPPCVHDAERPDSGVSGADGLHVPAYSKVPMYLMLRQVHLDLLFPISMF
jgi:hypothetical protein